MDSAPVPLMAGAPAEERLGGLAWRGGLHLRSDDPRFGGVSGLAVAADGAAFAAITDAGHWITGALAWEGGRLAAAAGLEIAPLRDAAGAPLTLQRMLGWLLAPAAWLMGVPWEEAAAAGRLLGIKIVLNELVSYLELARLPAGELGERSRLIMTWAMCGFANFGGLGVMIGGLGAIAPSRRGEIVRLGMKALIAGNLATCMTGAVVALLA